MVSGFLTSPKAGRVDLVAQPAQLQVAQVLGLAPLAAGPLENLFGRGQRDAADRVGFRSISLAAQARRMTGSRLTCVDSRTPSKAMRLPAVAIAFRTLSHVRLAAWRALRSSRPLPCSLPVAIAVSLAFAESAATLRDSVRGQAMPSVVSSVQSSIVLAGADLGLQSSSSSSSSSSPQQMPRRQQPDGISSASVSSSAGVARLQVLRAEQFHVQAQALQLLDQHVEATRARPAARRSGP